MAKIQSKAKRVLAIVLSLMMVLGACFTGMVTASAESLTDGLTAIATTATDSCGINSTATVVTDVSENGGVNISTTGFGGYRPYVHNVGIGKFPHGGVTLQFDGFTSSSSESNAGTYGYQSMLIVLSTVRQALTHTVCVLPTFLLLLLTHTVVT